MSDFSLFERCRTENFSTALVVFAARQSCDFAGNLLGLILRKAGYPEGVKLSVDSIERNLAITVDGAPGARLPDICLRGEIDGKPCVVLVEAKISAGEGVDQLCDYKNWLSKQEEPVRAARYPHA